MMTSKAHGYRWKFLIESFKEKVKTGEVYVAGTSTDEEAEREKQKNERELEHIRRRNMSRDTTAKRILRESVGEASGDIPPAVVDKDQDPFSGEDQGSDAELSVLQRSPTPKQRGKPSSTSEKGAAGLPLSEKPDSQKTPRPRIKFVGASSDEDSEEEQMQHAPKFLDKPVKIKSKAVFADESYAVRPLAPTVRFFQYKDEDEAEEREKEYGDQKPVIPVPAVVKIDKECWTHEPEYDKYLHVRIYKPVCKKAPTPFCSVAFHGQLLKTEVFEEEEEEPSTEKEESGSPALGSKTTSTKTEGKTKIDKQKSGKTWNGMNTNDKSTSRKGVARGANKRAASPTPASRPQSAVFEEDTKPGAFKEVKFKLPDDNGVTLGKPAADLTHEAFRLAVHPAKDRAMIAMATLNYGDLKIQDEVNEDFSSSDSTPSIQQFSLTSVVSDRDMPFNSTCGQISLFCYSSKIQRLTKHAKSTETIPFDDLVDATIEARRQEEMELQPNEVIQETPEPIYTEGDVMALKEQHAEEIQQLQEEYEKRLNELAQGLSPYPPELETSQDFVDAVTSPIIIKSPSLVRPESPGQTKTPKPPSNARTSPPRKQSRPRMPSLPEWGKDLPEDFLVRLNMFTENSSKYHQELGEKTRKVMQERYELQMAVQNRLAYSDDPETQGDTDVCLPAVFMPTRTSHVYSPKAHSYFHPPGSSESRLTQPPSIFKLPSVPSESQVSVLNLFEMSKKYRPTGPSWFTEDQARPHTIANPVQAQTASPPPTACDVWSPPPYQDRARTR